MWIIVEYPGYARPEYTWICFIFRSWSWTSKLSARVITKLIFASFGLRSQMATTYYNLPISRISRISKRSKDSRKRRKHQTYQKLMAHSLSWPESAAHSGADLGLLNLILPQVTTVTTCHNLPIWNDGRQNEQTSDMHSRAWSIMRIMVWICFTFRSWS